MGLQIGKPGARTGIGDGMDAVRESVSAFHKVHSGLDVVHDRVECAVGTDPFVQGVILCNGSIIEFPADLDDGTAMIIVVRMAVQALVKGFAHIASNGVS